MMAVVVVEVAVVVMR